MQFQHYNTFGSDFYTMSLFLYSKPYIENHGVEKCDHASGFVLVFSLNLKEVTNVFTNVSIQAPYPCSSACKQPNL